MKDQSMSDYGFIKRLPESNFRGNSRGIIMTNEPVYNCVNRPIQLINLMK